MSDNPQPDDPAPEDSAALLAKLKKLLKSDPDFYDGDGDRWKWLTNTISSPPTSPTPPALSMTDRLLEALMTGRLVPRRLEQSIPQDSRPPDGDDALEQRLRQMLVDRPETRTLLERLLGPAAAPPENPPRKRRLI